MDDLRFDGRVAAITGAGRGLGRAYALLLARQGAKVVVNDLGGSVGGSGADAGPAADVVAEIAAVGGEAVASTDTVSTPAGGRAIVETALDRFGRIDILIHNAGIARGATLDMLDDELIDAMLDVHVRGAFNVVRPAFRRMKAAGYGRIVLTSSIGGLYGNHAQAAYAAAKAAQLGINNVVAIEGSDHGVACNAIVPGAVTRMAEGIDVSRYPPMTSDMVAPAVAWLSHESCSVTGELIVSIAGRIARMRLVESRGVYRPDWTITDVGAEIDAITDISDPYVSEGHAHHIGYSFERARAGA